MSTRKLIQALYSACVNKDKNKERDLWFKALKKSLKHKKTFAVK